MSSRGVRVGLRIDGLDHANNVVQEFIPSGWVPHNGCALKNSVGRKPVHFGTGARPTAELQMYPEETTTKLGETCAVRVCRQTPGAFRGTPAPKTYGGGRSHVVCTVAWLLRRCRSGKLASTARPPGLGKETMQNVGPHRGNMRCVAGKSRYFIPAT